MKKVYSMEVYTADEKAAALRVIRENGGELLGVSDTGYTYLIEICATPETAARIDDAMPW